MNFQRFFTNIEIAIKGHILNPLWLSRAERHRRRTQVLSRVLTNYFKRYLPAVENVKEFSIEENPAEKIWTIWLQGEENAPDLVKASFRSVRRNCRQELVVLDEKSLPNFISLPEKILEKRKNGKIKNAHFADICRVELLFQHGGFWLDATGFVTKEIPQTIENQDFFMFLAGNVGSPYSFVQNCFIRAKKGAFLLAAWRAMILEFWQNENSAFHYFMHQLLFKTLILNDKRAKIHFEKMPKIDQDPTHQLWWGYKDKPFDRQIFEEITSKTFFQKTAYQNAKEILPNSFADEMIFRM